MAISHFFPLREPLRDPEGSQPLFFLLSKGRKMGNLTNEKLPHVLNAWLPVYVRLLISVDRYVDDPQLYASESAAGMCLADQM